MRGALVVEIDGGFEHLGLELLEGLSEREAGATLDYARVLEDGVEALLRARLAEPPVIK
jgi:hypothetical protein